MKPAVTVARQRALSHRQYLDTLQEPSPAESRRIDTIQLRKEHEIAEKYHTAEEHAAAMVIQSAYRGHRERRQLGGLTLDPSQRWSEVLRELKYRHATAPHRKSVSSAHGSRSRATSDTAKLWRRVGQIAERAGSGQATTSPTASATSPDQESGLATKKQKSLLLDQRYFLEMVDWKHRYGTNLQVYHEQWLRSNTSQNFFYWLDHGGGRHLDLPMCSREKLEKERIRYLSKEERKDYLVQVDHEGKLRWAKDDHLITTNVEEYQDSMHGIVPKGSIDPLSSKEAVKDQPPPDAPDFGEVLLPENFSDNEDDFTSSSSSNSDTLSQHTKQLRKRRKERLHVSPATILNRLLRKSVRPGTWIYVADTVGRLYVGIKSSGAFQHASFLSGARISSAGSIGIQDGKLMYLSPLSGHYRPTTKSFRGFVDTLRSQGVDTSALKVSKAYAVLLGLEYYGRSKKDLGKIVHPNREGRSGKRKSDPRALAPTTVMSATEQIERGWEEEHGN